MRVLVGQYPSNRWSYGGKERMLRELVDALRARGVEVDLLDPWAWEHDDDADVLQLFGSELYQHEMAVRARARGMRVVVHSILVYPDERAARRTARWRHVDRWLPLATSYSLRRDLLRDADAVVCASEQEARAVQQVYGVRADRVARVPTTVSPRFAGATPDLFEERTGLRDVVLAVGRLEPRKNVLALLRAVRPLELPVVVVGRADDAHPGYAAAVQQAVDENPLALHLGPLDPDDPLLASAYAAARVHALLSRSEQPGLVSLEAALAGANVVATPLPAVRELFGDRAWYADPDDVPGIRDAVARAYAAPRPPGLAEHLLATCGTPAAAARLEQVYEQVLARPPVSRS